ncbi:MAG: hypothetical protein AAFP84_07360 [Actinomycetota bacterium]
MRRPTDDRGYATAELSLAITFILIPLLVVSLAFAQWPSRRGVATAAAAEGARSAALANDAASAELAMAERVREVTAAAGLDPGEVTARLDGVFAPGEHITVTVTVDLPAVVLPLVGTYAATSESQSATERIEIHRSFER